VERIRDLVNLALPGVTLVPLPVAPRQIPFHSGANYFELETRNSDLWRQLEQSGGMAMHIAGDFPGLDLAFWAIRS
jgi:type VI secretion system protein ImpJ